MQTFLICPDYYTSHCHLDKSRLGNQIYREGLTLLSGGWPNHPASKAWKNHKYQLAKYLLAGVDAMEWRNWYKKETIDKWRSFFSEKLNQFPVCEPPTWVFDSNFLAAHRSNLLRKDKVWYGQFGWTEPDNLPYVWPVS